VRGQVHDRHAVPARQNSGQVRQPAPERHVQEHCLQNQCQERRRQQRAANERSGVRGCLCV